MAHISLREIQRRTGISRPSLIKYVKKHHEALAPYRALMETRDLFVYDERAIPMFQMFREAGIRKRGKRS